MADNKINVGGRLHSIATGNVLAGANEILDDSKNKKQNVINAEVDIALADRYTKEETYNKNELDSLITTPDVQYVTVTATEQTTDVMDVLPATGAANTIYRVGNWDGSKYTTTVYSEYAWNGSTYVPLNVKENGIDDEPTAGSDNLVKSGGIAEEFALGAVYDVSAKNPTAGSNNDGKWESLSALLSDANLNTLIPTSVRKGGMSIKFIQSSDNKYVQYFLTKDEWSVSERDWEKMNLALKKTSTFAGIATPDTNPGTPDGSVFYIATEAGTYSNFDGISVAKGEAVILQWDNGTWTKKVTGFATQEELLALRDFLSSLGIFSYNKDITSKFSIVSGEQTYGTVGSIVQFGKLPETEYTVVDIEGVYARFKSAPKSQVSSYIQYTDTNGIIVSRKFENIGNNVECEELIEFPEGATKCYITGARGKISIVEGGKESIITELTKKVDAIPEIGKLEDITVAENSKSIVDAINKACTLSITRNATVFDKNEAVDTWGATYDSFLTGEVGSKISLSVRSPDVRNIKIPVKDGYMITYPMFKTGEGNGSFLVDSNNIILEKFINNTEPDGTMNTITVSGYGNKEVYFYLSLYPYSRVTQKITIQTGSEVSTEQIPINKYLSKLLSNNYKENVSEEKALTTVGASNMYEELSNRYEELSNRMSSDSGVLFPCKDYGVMPSCQYGDSKAFLQDGVDAEGNAIIKYSDVIAKYDELVSAYPNYIKKKELGYDASGTIPMYAYTFEPKYPTQSIYLQAGVHGWEPDPVFALAMIATLIANAYGTTDGNGLKVDDDALKYIRENVKITIVPCVNPHGFNNRADCGIDKRGQAQNNANGVQLNGAWAGNAAEAVAVRGLIEELKQELSFAIDMHSTVWKDSRSRYGCFYGGVNNGSASLLTVFKTYEWLYRFYDIKYPSIVQGDSVPNPLGEGYASIGTMAGTFHSWIYSTYGIESTTMEFSDHVWTPELHTSVAMSVAVNMYLNQFVQHICARFKSITPKVDSSDIYPAKG